MTISDHFLANCIFIFHKTEFRLSFWGAKLIQMLWHKLQIFSFLFFCNFVTKTSYELHFWVFMHFGPYLLYQFRFRFVKHLKMIIWTSVLWNSWQLEKKWPGMVVKWLFVLSDSFPIRVYILTLGIQNRSLITLTISSVFQCVFYLLTLQNMGFFSML